jgi:hypothetical protein
MYRGHGIAASHRDCDDTVMPHKTDMHDYFFSICTTYNRISIVSE